MRLQGSLEIKSINTVGLRVNEGFNNQTLLTDITLDKFAKKTQYYFANEDRNVKLPDATTIPTGWNISIFNNKLSTGVVFLLDFTGIQQYKIKPKKSVSIILLENNTQQGVWKVIESGSGSGVGSRNVVITSNEDSIFTVNGGSVTIHPFIATVSNGFEEDGTPLEEIIEFTGTTALGVPDTFPKTKFVYLTLEGLITKEAAKQAGGNVFPTHPEEGDIFYNKPLRSNFKCENGTFEPYPCVAIGEVTWENETKAVATVYPYNEWWWDYKYGEVRNTVISSYGDIITVSSDKTTAAVGNFVATIADGFDPTGVAIDHYVYLPYTKNVTLNAGSTTYLYVDQYGNIFADNFLQDGYSAFPESTTGYGDGYIFYSIKDGRNYKLLDGSWKESPCVAIGEVDANGVAKVYPFNEWWWQYTELTPLVSHIERFVPTNEITQIILSTPCTDKNYLTINIGNTVIQSDLYDLASDGVTVSFINSIAAGERIEAKWYIPFTAVSVETTGGANPDLSNLTPIGTQKILPVGGNIGEVVVRSAKGAVWKPATGMSVGTIFMSEILPPNNPVGALPLTGYEVTGADTLYPDFWKDWLLGGKLATGTYEEYASALNANSGTCPFFGVDAANKKFKTPTWADGLFTSTAATETEVNKYYSAGLPNITGTIPTASWAQAPSGAFARKNQGEEDGDDSGRNGWIMDFDASRSSSVYGNSDTVTPTHIRKRWFVQVANAYASSYEHVDAELNNKVNKTGDTMSGDLKMSGVKAIRFGVDGNNYYVQNNAAGNFNIYHSTGAGRGLQLNATDNYAPYYKKSDNEFYRLLTTADLNTNIRRLNWAAMISWNANSVAPSHGMAVFGGTGSDQQVYLNFQPAGSSQVYSINCGYNNDAGLSGTFLLNPGDKAWTSNGCAGYFVPFA